MNISREDELTLLESLLLLEPFSENLRFHVPAILRFLFKINHKHTIFKSEDVRPTSSNLLPSLLTLV